MEKTSILVIDDDPNLRKTLADILKLKGFETVLAANGMEGLAIMRDYPVNLALIDIGLPDISGVEVLKRIKADYPFTEAIILTGNATLDSAIEATNKGAFSYLLKPYEIEQLLMNIRRAIEKQQAENALKENALRLKTLLNLQPSCILVVDPETHTITDANPAAVRMIGAPREEIVGKLCHSFVCPAEVGKCPITDLGMKVENSERMLLNVKGESIPIVKSVVPMKLDGREYLIENFIDITELKRLQDELTDKVALLEAALSKVKQLEGIIPICSYCKKIRVDKESWQQLESYITEHSEALFSHNICPECSINATSETLKELERMKR